MSSKYIDIDNYLEKIDKKLPELTHSKVLHILQKYYNLQSFTIKKAPRGFTAQTFFVHSQEKYLLKIIPKERVDQNFEKVLKSLSKIAQLGVCNITRIQTDKNQNLSVDLGNAVAILFFKIDAEWVLPDNLSKDEYMQMIDLLKKIHSYTKKITNLPIEDFAFDKHIIIKELIKKLEINENLDKKSSLLKNELSKYIPFIKKQIKLFEWILDRALIEAKKSKWVITHGDSPGNIMVKEGEVFIIDWDGLLLAPIERDVVLIREEHIDYFMNYNAINPIVFNYYILQRYFDDIHDFIIEIFRPECSLLKVKEWIFEMKEESLNKSSWIVHLINHGSHLLYHFESSLKNLEDAN